MTTYSIEHFQWGKLENEASRRSGSDFDLIAHSPGLTENPDVQLIPRQFWVFPTNIEKFSDAYGWYKWQDALYVLGHFQRSPNVEYPDRPHYFVQAHYALIPSNIINELDGDLSPLFNMFTSAIPRYSSVEILEHITVDLKDIKTRRIRQIQASIVPFIPFIFNPPAIFNGNSKSPKEKLDILTQIAICFPPEYRVGLPYITLFNAPLSYNIFTFAFSEDGKDLTGLPDFEHVPHFSTDDPGGEYILWLQEHIRGTLDESFFSPLRLGAEEHRSMQSLDRAVVFDIMWTNLQEEEDARYLSFAPKFLELYIDLLTTDESKSILQKITSLSTGQNLQFLAHVLVTISNRDEKMLEYWIVNLSEQVLISDNINKILDFMADHANSQLSLDRFAQAVTRHTKSERYLSSVIGEILRWRITNAKREPMSIILDLVNTLIEVGDWKIAFHSQWWILISFSEFSQGLSLQSQQNLQRLAPNTLKLVFTLTGILPSSTNDYKTLLIDSYQEVGIISWLLASIGQAVQTRSVWLLSPSFFETLGLLLLKFDNQNQIAGLIPIFGLIKQIAQSRLFESIAKPTSGSLDTEMALHILRDFVLILLQLKNVPPNASREDDFLDILSGLSYLYISVAKADLDTRDTKLEHWIDAFAMRIPGLRKKMVQQSTVDINKQLEIAVYAKRTGFPKEYLPFFKQWIKENGQISPETLYIWLVVLGYYQRNRTELLEKSLNEKDADWLVTNIINAILGCSISKIRDYLRDFSLEIHGTGLLQTTWVARLPRLPFDLPPYDVAYWTNIADEFSRLGLKDESNALQQGIKKLEISKGTSKALSTSLRLAESGLFGLAQILNELNSLSNEDRKDYLYYIGYLFAEPPQRININNSINSLRGIFGSRDIRRLAHLLSDLQTAINKQEHNDQ